MTEKWGLAVAGPFFSFTDTVTVPTCLNGYGKFVIFRRSGGREMT